MYQDPNAVDPGAILAGLGIVFFFIAIISTAIYIIPMWKIFSRTGMSGALSLLMLIPLVNIIMLYYLGFGSWPVEEELKRLRAQGAGGGWQPQPNQPQWGQAPGQQQWGQQPQQGQQPWGQQQPPQGGQGQ